MKAKKLKLKTEHLHTNMTNKHKHHEEDHAKIMKIIAKLKKLLEEMKSHDH